MIYPAENRVLPACEYFVDESGSPDVHTLGVPGRFYVACAVALPTLRLGQITERLPTDASGTRMKFSASGFREKHAHRALDVFFATDCYASVITLDMGDETELGRLRDLHTAINIVRSRSHMRTMTLANVTYSVTAPVTLSEVHHVLLYNEGAPCTYVDATLDERTLTAGQAESITWAVQNSAEQVGVHIRRLRWANEEQAPGLLLADILCGIVRRHLEYDDCISPFMRIAAAVDDRRISLVEGLNAERMDEYIRSVQSRNGTTP